MGKGMIAVAVAAVTSFIIASLLVPFIFLGAILTVFGAHEYEAIANPIVCIDSPGKLPKSVPQPMNSIFTKAANYYKIPKEALAVVYYVENGGVFREPPPPYGKGAPWPVSRAYAYGPFQFIMGTWWLYRDSNPAHPNGDVMDMVDAAFGAAHALRASGVTLSSQFGSLSNPAKGTIAYGLVLYNSGTPDGLKYAETQKYLQVAAPEWARLTGGKKQPPIESPACASIRALKNTKGYPSTYKMKCQVGVSAGIFTTAKNNTIRLCNIHGLLVNTSIAVQTEQLWQAAKQAGFTLSGFGFRTQATQISLRKAHCGTSHYAIWEMPPSTCSPPTNIPGESTHEQGFAMDLSANGQMITSHGMSAWVWLDHHAIEFGFKNLPSEPWHWSTTGH